MSTTARPPREHRLPLPGYIGSPHVKHLRGSLWEMRMRGKDGTSRALYVTIREKRVVVIRVFTKKTRETPRREIDLALQRARMILD